MKGRIAASAVIAAGLVAYFSSTGGRNAPESPPPPAQAVAPTQNRPKCQPSDFEIEGFVARVYDDCRASSCPALKLTGRLRNRCALPAGAKIRITATDKAGVIIDTVDGWPASTRNIQPAGTYPFDFGPLMTYRKTMANFAVEVVEANTWR